MSVATKLGRNPQQSRHDNKYERRANRALGDEVLEELHVGLAVEAIVCVFFASSTCVLKSIVRSLE